MRNLQTIYGLLLSNGILAILTISAVSVFSPGHAFAQITKTRVPTFNGQVGPFVPAVGQNPVFFSTPSGPIVAWEGALGTNTANEQWGNYLVPLGNGKTQPSAYFSPGGD